MKKIVLVLIVLALAILACGDSAPVTGEVVGTLGPPTSTTAPAQLRISQPGEIIQFSGGTIVMHSATISGGVLKATFTITNTGTETIAASSLMDWEAKDSDGVAMDQSWDCNLGGEILPGDKIKGDMCYPVTGAAPYRLYYRPNLLGSEVVIWEVAP